MDLNNTAELLRSVEQIISYWKNQDIKIDPITINDLHSDQYLSLPEDFKFLYRRVNGMSALYPNYNDKNGFLFYPLNAVVSARHYFPSEESDPGLFMFIDYLSCCWWYGFKVRTNGTYSIGIVLNSDTFVELTDSLADFIQLYIEDAEKLYQWEFPAGI